MKKWTTLFMLLGLALVGLLIAKGLHPQPGVVEPAKLLPSPELVVIADPQDPYASLAAEISDSEGALRLDAIEDLATLDPAYVVYVASPEWLEEGDLLALSSLSLSSGRYPAVGIISGSTLEQARALWQRGSEVRPGRGFVAGAADRNAGFDEGHIFELTGNYATASQPLSKANLLAALQQADYFYWARHVARRSWFWYEGDEPVDDQQLTAEDLPELGPLVIHSPSCRSFTPWEEASIALAFVDSGAAAYLGHLYPPISSGYFIGHLAALPGYDTWPGVSMGTLAQVQNRSAERAFAKQPYFFMLGDPRIAFQEREPYTVTSDTQVGKRRVIRGTWESAATSPGVLPLHIADGASYHFLRAKGIGAASDSDPFYNRSVQMLNVQNDKVILLLHPGGEFEVELARAAPLWWRPFDALRDAFEFVWCSIAPLQSPLSLLFLALLALVVVIKVVRKQPLRPLLPAFYVGCGWAALQLLFCLLCAGRVSVTSYAVQPTPFELLQAFVGTAAIVTLGLMRMTEARRVLGKLLGLAICVLPSWLLLLVYAGMITLLNTSMASKSAAAIGALNYAPLRMALIVALIEMVVFLLGYRCGAGKQEVGLT